MAFSVVDCLSVSFVFGFEKKDFIVALTSFRSNSDVGDVARLSVSFVFGFEKKDFTVALASFC